MNSGVGHIWRPNSLDSLLTEINTLESEAAALRRPLLWRGHASCKWLLESTFIRSIKHKILGFEVGQSPNERLLTSPLYSRVLRSLLLYKFGLRSGPSEELFELEQKEPEIDPWFEYVRRCQQYPDEDLACPALLQGTNLLDFSRSFEVALWFALDGCSAGTEPALYVYDPVAAGPVLSIHKLSRMLERIQASYDSAAPPDQPMIYCPSKQIYSPRVKAQQAVYVAQMAVEFSLDEIWIRRWREIHEVEHIFVKFIISEQVKQQVAMWLAQRGRSKEEIYPDEAPDASRIEGTDSW